MAWRNLIVRGARISKSYSFLSDGLNIVKLRYPVSHASCGHTVNWTSVIDNRRHFASGRPAHESVKPNKEVVREGSTAADAVKSDESTVGKVKKLGIKDMVKKYGVPYIVWYSSLYFGTGTLIFIGIESGLLGLTGADVIEWVRQTGYFVETLDKINPQYGNIGVAIVINECLEVVRFPFALATTPYIARTWKKFSEKKKTDEKL